MRSLETTLLALAIVAVILWFGTLSVDSEEANTDEQTFSGPYSHENLSIYLIHGPDEIDGDHFITLSEAMEKKLVTVHETGNVGELAIENRSADHAVFIQSGDIVKGGRQDRTLAYDVVVPPRSGKMPIKSFCVESGRWSRRGGEDAGAFSSNTAMLSSRKLKLAAKEKADQSAVWSGVAETQNKLSDNLEVNVRSTESRSSLQLTLEGEEVDRAVDEYTEALEGITSGNDDVIGFAFAINGEVNNIDVYASATIFERLWPKLLASAVVEAISERRDDGAAAEIGEEDVAALMKRADAATEQSTQAVSSRTEMRSRGDDEAVVFETTDQGKVLHKNYIARPQQEDPSPDADPQLQQIQTLEQPRQID